MSTLQVGHTGLVDAPRRWDFLASLMLSQGYKTFVEVGCKEGRTTGHILKNVPDSRVIAIDPWIAQEKSSDPTRESYENWDFEKIAKEFDQNVGNDGDRCMMVKATSEEAVLLFETSGVAETNVVRYFDEAPAGWPRLTYGSGILDCADIVFIDALHDYEHVKQDIALWWPKVRVGGILSLHDFNHKWPGVERAIAEAFDLMHVGVGPDSVAFIIKHDEGQYRGVG
jgi:SAM-dependent methyltransferase